MRETSVAGQLQDPRTRRRAVRHRNARLWLAAIFFLLRPADFFILKYAHAAREDHLIAASIILFVWTTGLLAAVWLRCAWARYVLIGLMLFVAVPAALTGIIASETALSVRLSMIVTGLLYLCAVIMLASSSAIKDLISRAKD